MLLFTRKQNTRFGGVFLPDIQYEVEPFGLMLSNAMAEQGVSCKRLEDFLLVGGVTTISRKRIGEYCNSQHTPTFEKAKAIFRALDYDISDEELLESLRLNRYIIASGNAASGTNERFGRRELRTTIRLKLWKVVPSQTTEETEQEIKNRIRELFGEERHMGDYVQWLIAKDLREAIISKEEIEDG